MRLYKYLFILVLFWVYGSAVFTARQRAVLSRHKVTAEMADVDTLQSLAARADGRNICRSSRLALARPAWDPHVDTTANVLV